MDELPKSVRVALTSPDREKWIDAMEAEFKSIRANQTWVLVNRPPNTKVMTSRWVFVIKRNQHGEIERYKTRISLRGFEQVFGSDYWEIYSPIVSMEAIRTVICWLYIMSWIYAKSTFLLPYSMELLMSRCLWSSQRCLMMGVTVYVC
ncbi:Copia type Polyprotein [Phytophthora megakarya]|uniref:Copia type Polyprotein n=1 Tax=Phytophthora megakarya TaxID=4795 RepID=A0A225VIB1_9STRA|nr:Copia type Polyprotein [Phytophthora megakarya]